MQAILPLNIYPLDFVLKMEITSYWIPVGPVLWTHGAERFPSSSVGIKFERKSVSFHVFLKDLFLPSNIPLPIDFPLNQLIHELSTDFFFSAFGRQFNSM